MMSRSSASKLATAEASVMETTTGSKVGARVVLPESVSHMRTGLTVGVSVGGVLV